MSHLKTRKILCFLAMTCILLMVPFWSMPGQNQSGKYLEYRDKLDKLKTLAEAKMKNIRDEANQKFLGLGKELDTFSPEQIGAWLRDHRSEEAQAAQIWEESATRRDAIYNEYRAERERLEHVSFAGGLGKVGYVFIGDVEYDAKRRPLEAWHAGLKNLITLGWLTGNQPSKLEDFEPLIRKKELMLGQKFETIITVYLAQGKDLTKALEDSKTAGYVWISHGQIDRRAVLDDAGNPVNTDTLKPSVEAAQRRYIMENLPPHLAKLYEETKSGDENVREAANEQIRALKGEDSELYDYVGAEALKVNLGLKYVEHFACLSGAEGAQNFANMLMGEDGVFIGYKGVVDSSGGLTLTFRGLTSMPTRFKSQKGKPDPNPQKTIRNKLAATTAAVTPPGLLVQRDYWDPEKTKIKREFTYYMRSDGKEKIRHGKETIWYNDGKTIAYLASRRDGKFHGTMTRYWASGKVFDITIFNDGSKEGAYTSYWNNEKIRSRGEFRKNRKCGPWSFFLENGNLEAQGPYYRKFSTIIVGCRNTNADDPTFLDDGLSWECGNKFGKWTLPDGREQIFEQRGDLDNEVDRAIWGRPKSVLEKSLEIQIKTLSDESGKLYSRIHELLDKKDTGKERSELESRIASLEKKIKEFQKEDEEESERINRPIRENILAKEAELEDLCPVIVR